MTTTFRLALATGLAVLALAPAAPAAERVPGQLIVDFTPGTPPAARAALERAAGVTGRLGTVTVNGAHVLRVAGNVNAAVARLRRSPAVRYAEPDKLLRTLAIPNDPRFGELYGIHNTGQSNGRFDADLDGPEGWDRAGLGAFPRAGGVEVGIVDTGIDRNHPDLAGKLADCASAGVMFLFDGVSEGGCSDDNDHGTHVSGTIAAIANNGVGVAGVAFNASLSHCKALSTVVGIGSTAAVANCIAYLARDDSPENHSRVRVISMSLGGGPSTTLRDAVRSAWDDGNGVVLVAAAGNDGDDSLSYPAAYPEVISVAATDRNDRRAWFSNANTDVELAAAGVGVLSTVRGGYAAFSGTSMATPHVAGVAALVRSRNPGWTAAQVRAKLQTAVDDLGTPGRDPQFGFGRVNLDKAMN